MIALTATVHPSATIHPSASIGDGSRVWDLAQLREGVVVGDDCVIGRNVYIDKGVQVGSRCKIQNNVQVFAPGLIGDGVFIGPGAILTNDRLPRAVDPDGHLISASNWTSAGVKAQDGCSIGAGAIIIAGLSIGRWAVVAAGAVVTENVLAHALVAGVPARRIGWVGLTGQRLSAGEAGHWRDEAGTIYEETEDGMVALG